MTTYQVPYTFVPGTKAKATEVNANFEAVVDFVSEVNTNCAAKDLSNITQDGLNVIYNHSSHSKMLGEIITSMVPLVDSGLHLLDGAIILGSGMYHDFVEYIAGLSTTHSNLFLSEQDWQDEVLTNGVCGKFVYDAVNNTVRLPLINGFVEGTADATQIGDFIAAGLPDHTHTTVYLGATDADNGGSGGNYVLMDEAGAKSTRTVANSRTGLVTDKSIYSKSDTVQPSAIKVLYYIVISTTAKLDIVVDIDEVATDINAKLNAAAVKRYPVETYHNGTDWYCIYSDGWIEQGGETPTEQIAKTVTYLKPFSSTDYTLLVTSVRYNGNSNDATDNGGVVYQKTNTFYSYTLQVGPRRFSWFACGY